MEGKLKKKDTSQQGITLIALVITIIVLLILAGVSINAVVGQNGVLNKATESVEKYKKSTVEEEVEMLLADWQMDYVVNKIPYDGRTETTENGLTVTCSEGQLLIKDNESGKKYIAPILENGKVNQVIDTEEDRESQIYKATHPEAHIPEGYVKTEDSGEWNTGFVIKELTTGDEFVWIPVINEEVYTKKAGVQNVNVSKVGKDEEGTDYVQTGGITGDFLGLTSILDNTVTNSTTVQYPEKEIVFSAGGFYVARYEMGIASQQRTTGTQADGRSVSPSAYYSKKGMEPAREITQTEAISIANNWKTTNGVQSGLITGTQWDVVCNFLGWSNSNGDCTNWGNFANINSKQFGAGEVWHAGFVKDGEYQLWKNTAVQKGNRNVKEDFEKTDKMVFGTGEFIGITDNGKETSTKNKNIYDFAGNVWEWTTEVPKLNDGLNRVIRGGSTENFGQEFNATTRIGHNTTEEKSWNVGFRAVLYVK